MAIPEQSPSDAELILYMKDQNPAAFELLYERYHESICRHLENIVRSEAAAQDLTQEAFLRVWQHAEQWSGAGSFKNWLYRIATHLAFNWLRSQKRRPQTPLVMPDEGSWDEWSDEEEPSTPGWLVDQAALSPAWELEQREGSQHLWGMIEELPEEKREVFRLVHEIELSIHDAAGRLGIPEGTVKSRLHYAQKKIRQEWQEWDED